jgi:HlyD family secretion protein
MSIRTRILGIAAVAAIIGLVVWAFLPQPLRVETAVAQLRAFETTINEDGRTRLTDRYTVTAPIAARLERIALREGDVIRAGQSLATLHPLLSPLLDERTLIEQQAHVRAAEATLVRARTQIESAKVGLEVTEHDLRRAEQLARQGFISPSRLEADRLAVLAARKELDAAMASEKIAAHELEEAQAALSGVDPARLDGVAAARSITLRSPVSGQVLKLHQGSAATVSPGTALLDVGDISRLRIVAELLTTDALQVRPGSKVRIERWGGPQTLHGRVARIEPGAFTKVSALGVEEQRVNVIIELTSPQVLWSSLGDAYRVAVLIVTREVSSVLTVPVSAVFPRAQAARDEAMHAVFVVREGRARVQPVRMEARNSGHAWIRDGLQAGDEVIVYPPPAVKDGVRIHAMTPRPQP